jgi:TrmH family RNA methyltransferase
MISKNEIKYIQSLSDKKTRDEEEVFIAEGTKLVNELLNGNIVVKKIYALEEWLKYHQELNNVTIVNETELKRISGQQTPKQVLAIVQKKKTSPAPQLRGAVTLVLDGIQDPGNLGTIIRIADWFGIAQIVAAMDTADLYNPKVVQSTMGSILRVDIWYNELPTFLKTVQLPIYGALLQGSSIYTTRQITEGIIVIGNEAQGIRENVLPFIKHAITIPSKGRAESLNAAVATGIILSHLLK